MSNKWVFTKEGKPIYYEEESRIYDRNGVNLYWIADGWWFRVSDGQSSYYINDNWVFTPDGKPIFYY